MNPYVVTVTLNPALDKTVTLDKLKVGGLNRVGNIRVDPGGKGVNVAKVLNKFGVNVVAAGLIAGFQGQLLLQYLEEERIKSRFIKVQGETRVNMKIIEEQTETMTEINEAGFAVNNKALEEFEEELSGLLEQASLLVLSGSLPRGVQDSVYRKYIELAKGRGVKTILDADGDVLKEGIKALPYAIKPNIHELEKLFGRKMADDMEITRAARQLIHEGINLVIVSKGAEGAVVLDKNVTYSVKPFPIIPKSTVGAGDSMVAALAYTLMNNKPLCDIARWVTTAGTVTASKPGTQVCEIGEVQQFLDQVQLAKL